MTYYAMFESSLYDVRSLIEPLGLKFREIIEPPAVAAYEMRKDRTGNDSGLTLQPTDQFGHILKVKPQSVHSGVDLYMYREIRYSVLFCSMDYCIQQIKAVNLRLKPLVEKSVERCPLGIHDNYIGRDPRPAQFLTLIGHSHGKIVHLTVLKCSGDLDSS